MAYVYMVLCDDDSIYTGITNDIAKRMKNHAVGKGASHAKYMRGRSPVEIMALWQTDEYKVAAKLEYAIKKRLTRLWKLHLSQNPDKVCELFPHLSDFQFTPITNVKLADFIGND